MTTIRNRATLDTTQFQGNLNKMGRGVQSLGKSMSMLPGLGGALSVAGIAAMANKAMNAADEIDNLSVRMGLGVETVQAYKIGLEEAGLSMGDLESAVTRIERAQAEAISGNQTYAKSFRDLGISQERLESLNTEGLLQEVSQQMGELEGNADATAASYEVLGRSGGRLRQVLIDLNKDGIQAQIDAYKQLGLLMDTAMIQQLNLAQLQVERAGKSFSNFFATQTAQALDFGRVMKAMLGGQSFDEALISTGEQDIMALQARKDAEARSLESRKQQIESNAQSELSALQEKRRLESLGKEELRKELNLKLESARVEMEQADTAVARLKSLQEINALEGRIAGIKEDQKESTKEEKELDKDLSYWTRVGGRGGTLDGMGGGMERSGALGRQDSREQLRQQRITAQATQRSKELLEAIARRDGGAIL